MNFEDLQTDLKLNVARFEDFYKEYKELADGLRSMGGSSDLDKKIANVKELWTEMFKDLRTIRNHLNSVVQSDDKEDKDWYLQKMFPRIDDFYESFDQLKEGLIDIIDDIREWKSRVNKDTFSKNFDQAKEFRQEFKAIAKNTQSIMDDLFNTIKDNKVMDKKVPTFNEFINENKG